MAKANLAFSRMGNDGYKLARREDGVWFIKEGYHSASFGWTTTKWQEVKAPDTNPVIEACLAAHSEGVSSTYVGFGQLVVITDGKGLRLP